MQALLQTIAWIACAVYATIPSFWFLIHPRADYWRAQRSPYRALLPLWMAMWVVLGLLTGGWRRYAFYSSPWAWIPACSFFAAGFSIYARASKGFSAKQLGGLPEVLPGHKEQRLVTSGIRAHIRHPVYLGHLCEMLAWSVGTGLAVCYALTGFAMLTGAVMIRMEDEELAKRFGSEYLAYRDQVPAVLPRVRI